jgi:hypothetical protein
MKPALAALLLLVGCSASYLGLTKAQLVDRHGVPNRTVKLDDGGEAWEYEPKITYLFRNGVVVERKRHWSFGVSVNDHGDR